MREIVILLGLFAHVVFSANKDLVICLPDGKIQGTTLVTGNNKTYYGFLGIPYAAPPLGELRFEPPQPVHPWKGTWNATVDSKSCISSTYFQNSELQSEDCLHVDVYVPTLKPKHKLPVMFWIYGGAFTQGNKSFYGPDFLIEKEVIIVLLNYRLVPFGFLSTGDSALPGNLGLKDQHLALKWTKRNIKYFGGDPENITIFGESAGGTSVGFHLISKRSAGLFRAAMLQSGSALVYWAIDYGSPKTTAYLLADAIPGGSYGNDTQALKEFLKTKSVEEIMTAYGKLPSGVQFFPTIEADSEDAFITESPYESLANGRFNRVPIVIGICAEESLFFLRDLETTTALAGLADAVPTRAIPENLYPNKTDEEAVVDEIRSIYLKENETFSGNLIQFVKYSSDNGFNRGIIKQAQLASRYVPVYLYQFSYFGWPVTLPYIDGAEKASHAQEIPFLFNVRVNYTINYTPSEEDLLTQKRMVTLWTNFAKYLNPTPEKSDLFNNLLWPVLNSCSNLYVNINNTLEIRSSLKGDTVPKWDQIYETYGRKPFITF